MKVVILAGGKGTRLREETAYLPKPMVPIGNKPMLWHIMKIYAAYGHKDFILCLGYKGEQIREYFLKYREINQDCTVGLSDGHIKIHSPVDEDWNVTLVDTGDETQTGGRLKKVQKYVGDETFMATYGDGLSDVDLSELVEKHLDNVKSGVLATLTSVLSKSRFGEIETLENDRVTIFEEKSNSSRINGGFFVFEPEVFQYITSDNDTLEVSVLKTLTKEGKLQAYNHNGFWQCMDTYKETEYLNNLWTKYSPPWRVW